MSGDRPTSEPSAADSLGEALAFLGDHLRAEQSLGALCTYRVGGSARWLAEVHDEATLVAVGSAVSGLPDRPAVLVVGRGSNLLVAERGFPGLVIQIGEGMAGVRRVGSRILAGGAASLPVVARRSVAEGLAGFEWAVGVPGSIGGAVRMNAGGHGSEMANSLLGVRVVNVCTGETRHMSVADLDLSYRHSSVSSSEVVVEAELLLSPGDRDRGEALLSDIVRWRRENQPGGHNAGSVFANPAGDSAGRLIDEAGCKGLGIGSAAVSEKHANFIQVADDGSADDVFALMVEVARRVRASSGTELRPETRLIGFPDFVGAAFGEPHDGDTGSGDTGS